MTRRICTKGASSPVKRLRCSIKLVRTRSCCRQAHSILECSTNCCELAKLICRSCPVARALRAGRDIREPVRPKNYTDLIINMGKFGITWVARNGTKWTRRVPPIWRCPHCVCEQAMFVGRQQSRVDAVLQSLGHRKLHYPVGGLCHGLTC